MRRWITAIVCGFFLATVGGPAAPALAAKGVTCTNLVDYAGTVELQILARTCIAWDHLPAGNRWTHYQSKIWNPPGAPEYNLTVNYYYNNGGRSEISDALYTDDTGIKNPNSVGPYTAKFEVVVDGLPGFYCMYMVPGGFHQENDEC